MLFTEHLLCAGVKSLQSLGGRCSVPEKEAQAWWESRLFFGARLARCSGGAGEPGARSEGPREGVMRAGLRLQLVPDLRRVSPVQPLEHGVVDVDVVALNGMTYKFPLPPVFPELLAVVEDSLPSCCPG